MQKMQIKCWFRCIVMNRYALGEKGNNSINGLENKLRKTRLSTLICMSLNNTTMHLR